MIFPEKRKIMAYPIWQDYIAALGTSDSIYYRITLSDTGEVVYSGKAYRKPGQAYILARINDICADYLETLRTLSQAELAQYTLPLTFQVQTSADGQTWTTQNTVQFLNDWSYDYDYESSMGMSFPINGRIDRRMPMIWTGVGVTQVRMIAYLKTGGSTGYNVPLSISSNFDAETDSDFSKAMRAAGSGTAVFYLGQYRSDWSNVDRIGLGNSTFRIVTECAEYALYYLNAYGGWDAFLIEGNTLETDNLQRYIREAVYDNRDIQNRGSWNYVNEVDKGFTFHTGKMTGEQGKRMHHLINSTDVYLYDIADEKMIPVNIVTPSCDYKTFKNQGGLVDYTIQVQVAKNRIRR